MGDCSIYVKILHLFIFGLIQNLVLLFSLVGLGVPCTVVVQDNLVFIGRQPGTPVCVLILKGLCIAKMQTFSPPIEEIECKQFACSSLDQCVCVCVCVL